MLKSLIVSLGGGLCLAVCGRLMWKEICASVRRNLTDEQIHKVERTMYAVNNANTPEEYRNMMKGP